MKKILPILVIIVAFLSGCSDKNVEVNDVVKGFTDENGVTFQVLPIEVQGDQSYLGVHVMNGSPDAITVDESNFILKDSEGMLHEPTNAKFNYELAANGEVEFKLNYETPQVTGLEVIYDSIDSNVVFS